MLPKWYEGTSIDKKDNLYHHLHMLQMLLKTIYLRFIYMFRPSI